MRRGGAVSSECHTVKNKFFLHQNDLSAHGKTMQRDLTPETTLYRTNNHQQMELSVCPRMSFPLINLSPFAPLQLLRTHCLHYTAY